MVHHEAEERNFGNQTCKRLTNNYKSHAKDWCSYNGGVDWDNTNWTCSPDGDMFTKVSERITCNN